MANYAHPESRGYGPDPSTHRDFQGQDSYRGGATTRDSQGQSFNQDRFGAPNRGYQGNYDQDRLGRNYQTQGNYSQGTQGGQDSARWGYNQAQGGNFDRNSQTQGFGGARNQDNNYGGAYGTGRNQSQSESRGRHFGRGPRGYSRSDERLTEDLNERLTQHPEIDASEIEVNVRNGEVTLTGTVDDRQTKRMIEDLAEEVSGVREVHNQIRVQRGDSRQTSASSTASSTASGSRTPSPTATHADSAQSTTRSAGAKA